MLTTHFVAFFSAGLPADPGDVLAVRLRTGGGGVAQHYALKDPESLVDWGIEWQDLAAGETIAGSAWSVSPAETGGLAVVADSPALAGQQTSCRIEGGRLRRVYSLKNVVTTSTGRVLAASMTFRIGVMEAGL
jgi:hypothetical protein